MRGKQQNSMRWWHWLAIAVLAIGGSDIAWTMYKGPMTATLEDGRLDESSVAKPEGDQHPAVTTEMTPLGLGTKVALHYRFAKHANEKVCFVSGWLNSGVVQPLGRADSYCQQTDSDGVVTFFQLIQRGDYGKKPSLVAAVDLGRGEQQVDHLVFHRR